jgi:hypothetical protein
VRPAWDGAPRCDATRGVVAILLVTQWIYINTAPPEHAHYPQP